MAKSRGHRDANDRSAKRSAQSGRPPARAGGRTPPIEPDTPRTSDLILPGGKVDKRAIHRALRPAAPSTATQPAPATASTDDELVEGLAEAAAIAAGASAVGDVNSAAPIPSSDPSQDAAEPPDDAESDDAPAAQRVVFRLKRDLNKRLDKYLTDRITFMSRAQLQRLIAESDVLVNTRPAKAATTLRAGDVVEVFVPPPASGDTVEEDIPLAVLFEDEHLIVLNKSPDIIVHPARSNLSGTMVNALAYHFRHRSPHGGSLSAVGKTFARPGVVHRLDRQTSGVILFAKTEQAHWLLARQFMDRTVEKRYLAFVHGLVEPRADVIDVPLGPHPSRQKGYREMHVVRHDHLGKPATTVYRVLMHAPIPKPAGSNLPDGASVVEVELKTGRTHQIRVHFAHRGFPLLADDMYGGRQHRLPAAALIARVALHAALLEFRHPITNKLMSLTAPLPPDLARLLTALRAQRGAEEFSRPPGSRLILPSP